MLKPLVTTPIHRQTGQWGENEVVRNPPLLPILLNKGHQSLKKKKTRYMFECPLLQVTSCYCLTEGYIDISLWWKVKALNVSQFQFRLAFKVRNFTQAIVVPRQYSLTSNKLTSLVHLFVKQKAEKLFRYCHSSAPDTEWKSRECDVLGTNCVTEAWICVTRALTQLKWPERKYKMMLFESGWPVDGQSNNATNLLSLVSRKEMQRTDALSRKH